MYGGLIGLVEPSTNASPRIYRTVCSTAKAFLASCESFPGNALVVDPAPPPCVPVQKADGKKAAVGYLDASGR